MLPLEGFLALGVLVQEIRAESSGGEQPAIVWGAEKGRASSALPISCFPEGHLFTVMNPSLPCPCRGASKGPFQSHLPLCTPMPCTLHLVGEMQ